MPKHDDHPAKDPKKGRPGTLLTPRRPAGTTPAAGGRESAAPPAAAPQQPAAPPPDAASRRPAPGQDQPAARQEHAPRRRERVAATQPQPEPQPASPPKSAPRKRKAAAAAAAATGDAAGRDRKTGKRAAKDAPNTPPPRSKAAKHPIVILFSFFLTIGSFLVLGAAVGVYWGYAQFTDPGPLEQDRMVQISRGSSVSEIAATLEDDGVITNRWVFVGAAQYLQNAERFQAGEYVFPAGATMAEAMRIIIDGRVVQHAVTIPEGLTSKQIVDLLNEDEVLVGPIDRIPLEGTLLPETYNYTRGTTRQALLDRMQEAQDRIVTAAWEGRALDLPIESPRDLVTLASIVEKETGQADERPHVAGVFVNRLDRRMKLQSDPTILYGLYGGSAWDRPRTIFRSDLERPNPYNTYQIAALPPGPIANPGRAAIEAVANPMETSDIYFVADGTGGHAFAETLAEHNRNVARWREIEAQRNSGSN